MFPVPSEALSKLVAPLDERGIRTQFDLDEKRLNEATEGAVKLADIVNFAHSIPIGVPGWNCCYTLGLHGGGSYSDMSGKDTPGICTDFASMRQACSSVVSIAGGATSLMLHLGLHCGQPGKSFRPEAMSFEDLRPWHEWLVEMRDTKCDT